MCRMLAILAREEPEVRSLLDGDLPERFVAPTRRHNAGWGVAWYQDDAPRIAKAPRAALEDPAFVPSSRQAAGRLVYLHIRRATRGRISDENTHPFAHGRWLFCHNGTIVNGVRNEMRRLIQPPTQGETDSEVLFHWLLHHMQADDPVRGLEKGLGWIIERSDVARLNFFLTDGEQLYAFRRGHSLFLQETRDRVVLSSYSLLANSASVKRGELIHVAPGLKVGRSQLF